MTKRSLKPERMSDKDWQDILAHDKAMVELEASLMQTTAEEWMRWKIEHVTLYGHAPDPDFLRRISCRHPMHQEAARAMYGADLPNLRDQFHPTVEKTLDDGTIRGAVARVVGDGGDRIRVFSDTDTE